MDILLRSLKYILLALSVYAVGYMSADAIRQFLESPYGMVHDVKMPFNSRNAVWKARRKICECSGALRFASFLRCLADAASLATTDLSSRGVRLFHFDGAREKYVVLQMNVMVKVALELL